VSHKRFEDSLIKVTSGQQHRPSPLQCPRPLQHNFPEQPQPNTPLEPHQGRSPRLDRGKRSAQVRSVRGTPPLCRCLVKPQHLGQVFRDSQTASVHSCHAGHRPRSTLWPRPPTRTEAPLRNPLACRPHPNSKSQEWIVRQRCRIQLSVANPRCSSFALALALSGRCFLRPHICRHQRHQLAHGPNFFQIPDRMLQLLLRTFR